MKFAERLSAHITPEWRKQYINYEEMKAMLYMAVEEAPSAESVEPTEITRHFTKFDERFFSYCDKELLKINTFYNEKLAESTRKFATLGSELSMSKQQKDKIKKKTGVPIRKLNDLRLAFSEYYLMLILLQSYQDLNYTGFRKILKKHDKLLTVDLGAKFFSEQVESAHFNTNKDIPRLIGEVETLVTTELESGDRQKAMKRLRVPPLGEQQSPWTTFKVGLFSGSFIVLIIAVVLSAIFHDGGGADLNTAFKLYRAPLLVVEFLFLIGVNVYFWRSSGVNHVLIFELDPRNHLSEQHLMEVASILGVVWCLSMLSFLYSDSLSIPPYINPLSLCAIFIVFSVNPMHTFRHEARFWSLKVIGRMVAAPLFHVGFADFWLADQLNSLVTVLLDLHFLVCFYFTNGGDWLKAATIDSQLCSSSELYLLTRALVNCFPAWIRFAQCLRRYYDSREAFPHLANAGKYATTFFVVFFAYKRSINRGQYGSEWESPYLWWWALASAVSSVYAYTWDIKMDWGLLDKKAGDNTLLREEIVYSSTSFYHFAMLEDLVLRFSWAFTLVLEHYQFLNKDLVSSVTAILEVFRRFIWNFFRLENEHLNNCGKFRAVRDISVAPMDSNDQTQIIRMMDEENGVTNRKPRRKKVVKPIREEKRALLHPDSVSEMGLSMA